MLIQIDNSLFGSIDDLTHHEWDGLVNLAIAAREGNHYLIAPRLLAEELSKHERLGPREKSLYRTLCERYSTLAGMANSVATRVRVTRDLVPARGFCAAIEEIRLPLTFFAFSSSIQPSLLLCENLDDSRLIYEFARTFANIEHLAAIKTKLEMRSGGGSTTADVAADVLDNVKRLIFAVVDSDRDSPAAPIGVTAQRVKRVFDSRNQVISQLIVLSGRELENLLPDDFYREKFGGHPDHGDSANFITSLSEHGCVEARLHIDIKEGLKLCDLLGSVGRSSDFNAVWGGVVALIAERRLPCSEPCSLCAGDEICRTPSSCVCVLTSPNRSSLLEIGCADFGRHGRKWWMALPEHLKAPIMELARKIFDWGCAGDFYPS